MPETMLDVVGIGNAIVDVLTQTGQDGPTRNNLPLGGMTLIDVEEAERLYEAMGPAVESSGGSAANTVAGVASLGGASCFLGKVRNDQLGGIFRHDISSLGCAFDTPAATEGPPTGRCLIFVTPDAQRTMATYLGAAVHFGPEDLDEAAIARAKVTYLEGYLWDKDAAKRAFLQAAKVARAAGRKVSLTLSDPFCVERHRDSFLAFVENHVDLLFANEAEITSLYQVDTFDQALQRVRGHCEVAILTRSEKGSVILSNGEVHVVDAVHLGPVVDTTGAGDLYAAGFLYGFTKGMGLYDCGRLGALAAGEVISHMGPRPLRPLRELLSERAG